MLLFSLKQTKCYNNYKRSLINASNFKKEVKGLGKVNDIVNVKDGYAKNYLIRNGFAVVVNEKNMQDLKSVLKKKQIFKKNNMIKLLF